MAYRKPRILISVDEDLNELLNQLAEHQDTPKATLVTNYLNQIKPHLTDILQALELVKAKQDPKPLLNKMLSDAEAVLHDLEEYNK